MQADRIHCTCAERCFVRLKRIIASARATNSLYKKDVARLASNAPRPWHFITHKPLADATLVNVSFVCALGPPPAARPPAIFFFFGTETLFSSFFWARSPHAVFKLKYGHYKNKITKNHASLGTHLFSARSINWLETLSRKKKREKDRERKRERWRA